ncbi:heavy-metal-associated domain-containing protein [Pseudomonas sp.]|uniref:heavy-metal-associated domain-containing protein n=1 Tax=Pseudomonas sp. TaxID=306 RepID=UPI0028AC676D|nr:cation transporter [Pseudomonas sp.]
MQTFQVKGMTCAHCERTVTQAIQARDADARVRVDLARGLVEVEAALEAEAIREAIREEGYEVQ